MTPYADFFHAVTEKDPFPYQERVGADAWPDILDVPTGMGKTAAIIVAWLWKRLQQDDATPRRLAYCLPMRVLVEQISREGASWIERSRPFFEERGLSVPSVQILMGGQAAEDWRRDPEHPSVLVGTQDMLLSRALMRGYGMSRYGWPVDYALLHSDCMWVYDEVQLMGPAVATSAQLEAFRRSWQTAKPSRTLWASATVRPDWLETIDFRGAASSLAIRRIDEDDVAVAGDRLNATKRLTRGGARLEKLSKDMVGQYVATLAVEVASRHRAGTQTIVIVNRVDRAQLLYRELQKLRPGPDLLLLHSRFRPAERRTIEDALRSRETPDADRILIATQAIEAGVDITSATLFCELAPWSSMVQRFGRCNRYGEVQGGADVVWIDLVLTGDDASPYTEAELNTAREILSDGLQDVGPQLLPKVQQERPFGQVIRERDFLELFNTDPDLQGFDIDVAPFIRDQGPPQVQVFWRHVESADLDCEPRPDREELCPVSMGQIGGYLKMKIRGENKRAWRWDPLTATGKRKGRGRWVPVGMHDRIVPGSVLMLHCQDGGYDEGLGFEPSSKALVSVLAPSADQPESYGADRRSGSSVWLTLNQHLRDVREAMEGVANALDLSEADAAALLLAAAWHDVGKAHPAFQAAIGEGAPRDRELWAKSPLKGVPDYGVPMADGSRQPRPYFRHELASMLAWLAHNESVADRDLVAYLIAAHHGKVRFGLRALPGENEPPDARPFARGVWDGDRLPGLELDGNEIAETYLCLGLMRMGWGEMGASWTERTVGLLHQLGPFKLSWLEALLRIADWRGSSEGEVEA